jgi:hypothetical protein
MRRKTMAREIDRLAKEANEALAHNMSYGKWKAMQKAEPKKKPPALLYDGCSHSHAHPELVLVCAVCGKVYVGRHPRRLYCSELCKGRATREMMRRRKQLAKNKGGEINA